MINRAITGCALFDGVEDFSFVDRCLMPRVKACVAGEKLDLTINGKRFFGLVTSGNIQCAYGSYKKGEVFGLSGAIADRDDGIFIARVKTDVLLFPADVFFSPCGKNCFERQRVVENAMGIMASELCDQRLQCRLLAVHGIRQRLCAYLKSQYDGSSKYLTIPFNRTQLADYLSVSRPSLSRALMTLRDSGVLEFDGKTIKIIKPEELC